jgi:hypothetical protein
MMVMQPECDPTRDRELTAEERHLLRWMLEHGGAEAAPFLSQVDQVRVTSFRCPCGCASINLRAPGRDEPSGGIRPVAEFVIRDGDEVSGAFVYVQSGQLGGIEVYGGTGDAPKRLPSPAQLHPWGGPAAA